MAFTNKKNAKTYKPQKGDTLQSIAERESAAGNSITWQEIAQYNWGTQDEDEVEALLRDELGTRFRNADNKFEMSGDDEPRNELKIPQRFNHSALSLKKSYQIRVRKKQSPKQFLGCTALPSITFGFDSSFINPAVVDYLSELENLAKEHPQAKIMVFGHTDATGDEMYNKCLSERRAWSAYAFIVNDVDAWETLYSHKDENWGVPVIQTVLADLGHDPGSIDGDLGPNTYSAMRSFLDIPDNAHVKNNEAFRKRLFAAYMSGKHNIDLPKERFMEPGYMGCGEFNPIEDKKEESERNRRAIFYLFDSSRIPKIPCEFANNKNCVKQFVSLESRYQKNFACSFYDSLSANCEIPVESLTLKIRLYDSFSVPIPYAPYKLVLNSEKICGEADENGFICKQVSHHPSKCHIFWGINSSDNRTDNNYEFSHEIFLDLSAQNRDLVAKKRLANLGYPVSIEIPLEEQQAIVRSFQRDCIPDFELVENGLLDDKTNEALTKVHDECNLPTIRREEQIH